MVQHAADLFEQNIGLALENSPRSPKEKAAAIAEHEQYEAVLRRLGARVTVLEAMPRVMARAAKAIKPGINAQYVYQRSTFNVIQRSEDRYQYENSNFESLQINTDLEVWMLFGSPLKVSIRSMIPSLKRC